jgi:RNA ligase (TIGR02306 family)
MHQITVFEINSLKDCPNADNLQMVEVDGYNCLVRKGDYAIGDLAVFIPPDSLVDTTKQEFSFLGPKSPVRIKAKKLRGIISVGLIIKAPYGFVEGDDVTDVLGVAHWNPPEPGDILNRKSHGTAIKGPDGFYPKYDIDSFLKYNRLFEYGESCWITEKIHGCNAMYTYQNGQIWCRSRTTWKKQDENCIWWKVLHKYPQIEEFCKNNPGLCLFGEIYGWVQSLRYGAQPQEYYFAAFDILDGSRWWDVNEFLAVTHKYGVPVVPTVAINFPYDYNEIKDMADGQSLIANHIREGIVIKPMKNRYDYKVGRVFLKLVSNNYYLLKE